MNRWIRDLLEGSPPQTHARRLVSLDRAEAESGFRAIENHPVAGTCQLDFYDPTGATGFCFGVAEAVRMELVKRGLNPDSIRKAWAMGGLWLEESSWDYHVSALVRAKEGGWWAIDPTFAGPIPAGEWIDRMEKANSRSKDLRLHLTSADRVTPVGRFDPSDRAYRGFFKDLAETYRREHQARRRRPRSGGSR